MPQLRNSWDRKSERNVSTIKGVENCPIDKSFWMMFIIETREEKRGANVPSHTTSISGFSVDGCPFYQIQAVSEVLQKQQNENDVALMSQTGGEGPTSSQLPELSSLPAQAQSAFMVILGARFADS